MKLWQINEYSQKLREEKCELKPCEKAKAPYFEQAFWFFWATAKEQNTIKSRYTIVNNKLF
jgi:hypothetical protein